MKDLRKALVVLLSLALCECKSNTNVEEPLDNQETTQEVNNEENKEEPKEGSEEKPEEKQEEKEDPNKVKIIDVNDAEVFNQTGADYKFKYSALSIYTVSNSELPHVDLAGFIKDLDGYFDSTNITNTYDKEAGEFHLFYKGDLEIIFDINNDLIKCDDCYMFYGYTMAPQGSDYSEFVMGRQDYFVKDSTFLMDVGAYDFDILYIENKCLMPLFLANLLFCSFNYFNIFYNNETCFATSGETTNIYRYFDCEDYNTNETRKFREETMNSLYLIFDYYYGLKEYKGMNGGFKNYIDSLEDGALLEKFLSEKPAENLDALAKFIYTYLDELHTRIDIQSFYVTTRYSNLVQYGDFYTNYYSQRDKQLTAREMAGHSSSALRYYGNMAVINLNSFDVGTKEQVKNKDGTIKTDAWRYDSYYYMKTVMETIEKSPDVSDIVIDLSTNGGGAFVALERVMGFITDKKIEIASRDTLEKSYEIDSYFVDVDNDGTYENDAYDQYNWHLLTGINTFSAGNLMTALFKQMDLGDVIGQRSGGGMCAVLPTVLADGTGIAISSPTCLQYLGTDENNKYTFADIEGGIAPDVELEYDKFYDDETLYSIVKGNN